MERVSAVKHTLNREDVTARAGGTLEKCIGHVTRGCAPMSRSIQRWAAWLEGVKTLVDRKVGDRLEIWSARQAENNTGHDARMLMVAALKTAPPRWRGRRITTPTPRGAIRRSSRWRANSMSTSHASRSGASARSSIPCWSATGRSKAGAAVCRSGRGNRFDAAKGSRQVAKEHGDAGWRQRSDRDRSLSRRRHTVKTCPQRVDLTVSRDGVTFFRRLHTS